ncbi:MAG: hypothetical protein Q4A92_10540 [Corynebacterium sp.]|nr:hypothetical protein [Corynebacterium sp.]
MNILAPSLALPYNAVFVLRRRSGIRISSASAFEHTALWRRFILDKDRLVVSIGDFMFLKNKPGSKNVGNT